MKLPELMDLSTWCATVESTIESLDDSFLGKLYNAHLFTAEHVKLFCPVVLGDHGW